jgi:hypothetical protein
MRIVIGGVGIIEVARRVVSSPGRESDDGVA